MSLEEKLARRLLENERESVEFDVELKDDHECDLVAAFLEKWGCHVERWPLKPRIRVKLTAECLASAN